MKAKEEREDKDKFDTLFESTEVCAFLYEKEAIPISQFKSHFNFSKSRLKYYLKRLTTLKLISIKNEIISGQNLKILERTEDMGILLAALFKQIVTSTQLFGTQKGSESVDNGTSGYHLISKAHKEFNKLTSILLRIEIKLRREGFLD